MAQSLDEQFQEAARLHNQGRFADAERLYRRILDADPKHPRATHFLGILAYQCGRFEEAESLIRASIQLRPDSAAFHNNLGDMLRARNKPAEALAAFLRAHQLDPRNFLPPLNIGMLFAARQRANEAVPWLRKTLELKSDQPNAMFLLGQALLSWPESTKEGIEWLDKCLALMPNHEMARFVRSAATGAAAPRTMPARFVQNIFDGYADDFDHHLVNELNYRGPQMLFDAVQRARENSPRRIDIIDLGCGTGLVGEVFRTIAKTLIGVDVSPRMLEKAKAKDLYDELELSEAAPALRSRAGKLDLVLAGDVFIYIGDLADVFTSAAGALRPAGLFAFTVESHEGAGYHLNPARRFAHSRAYIADLAGKNGFDIIETSDVVLRREAGADVSSTLYVLRKKPTN